MPTTGDQPPLVPGGESGTPAQLPVWRRVVRELQQTVGAIIRLSLMVVVGAVVMAAALLSLKGLHWLFWKIWDQIPRP